MLKILATTIQNLVAWIPEFVHTPSSQTVSKVASVQAIKSYGAIQVKLHPFLTSTLDGDEWTALCRFPNVETQIVISNPELLPTNLPEQHVV